MERFDPELLDQVWQGTWRAPSRFTLILPESASAPTPYELIERAAFCQLALGQVDAADSDVFALAGEGVHVALHTVEIEFHEHETIDGDIDGSLRTAVQAAHYGVTVEVTLLEPVLDEYHAALRTVATLVPDAIAIVDQARLHWLSGTWLQRAATSQAPPPPASLYKVHTVGGPDGDVAWLHTHGLLRCGAIEIEAVDVPVDHVEAVGHLLRATAMRFIEQGPPKPGEAFDVGENLSLAWLTWDAVAETRPADALGGMNDREDHDGLFGTLVAAREDADEGSHSARAGDSLSRLVPLVEGEPLFFVSEMETRRMALLATERFPDFRRLFRRQGAGDEWAFLAKLGYQVDGDEDDTDRPSEHLWFEVHGIDGAELDATLLNEPFAIARMAAGDRGRHAADQLSDWSIQTPEGEFGPDRVDALLRGSRR